MTARRSLSLKSCYFLYRRLCRVGNPYRTFATGRRPLGVARCAPSAARSARTGMRSQLARPAPYPAQLPPASRRRARALQRPAERLMQQLFCRADTRRVIRQAMHALHGQFTAPSHPWRPAARVVAPRRNARRFAHIAPDARANGAAPTRVIARRAWLLRSLISARRSVATS